MLIAVLALSALGYLAYRTLYGSTASVDREAPAERLENVQQKAKALEAEQQQRLDELERRTQE